MATILVVDDDFAYTDYARLLLTAMGHEVITCLEGALACEAARLEKPNLILLDLYIPDLDGFEVLKRLKADPVTRRIPVFLCSLSRDPRELQECTSLGAVGYLKKPLERDNLSRGLELCLR